MIFRTFKRLITARHFTHGAEFVLSPLFERLLIYRIVFFIMRFNLCFFREWLWYICRNTFISAWQLHCSWIKSSFANNICMYYTRGQLFSRHTWQHIHVWIKDQILLLRLMMLKRACLFCLKESSCTCTDIICRVFFASIF